ncbi:MAG: TolC family protein, partial [Acidobacteria bacterium]|nr:TolC family protein [Acidobacteriota bacterium]
VQARQELQRAWVETVPDLHLRVRPFYAFPDEDQRLLVEAGITLPLFNKNEGNIVAAQAGLARAAARVRQVQLRLTERLTGAFQRYEIARRQVETYDKEVLPNARESLRLVRLGWEKNDPKLDYNSVLLAQRTLVEARLSYVQALGELWRASSEIMELLQEGPPRPHGRPE